MDLGNILKVLTGLQTLHRAWYCLGYASARSYIIARNWVLHISGAVAIRYSRLTGRSETEMRRIPPYAISGVYPITFMLFQSYIGVRLVKLIVMKYGTRASLHNVLQIISSI